jgi:hypothetical protein
LPQTCDCLEANIAAQCQGAQRANHCQTIDRRTILPTGDLDELIDDQVISVDVYLRCIRAMQAGTKS